MGIFLKTNQTVNKFIRMTGSNLTNYFTVSEGTYTFKYEEKYGYWFSNNDEEANTSATLSLTLKKAYRIKMYLSGSSQNTYDKFTLTKNGTTIVGPWTGEHNFTFIDQEFASGDVLVFKYSKNGSTDRFDDQYHISDFQIQDLSDKTGVSAVNSQILKVFCSPNGNSKYRIRGIYYGDSSNKPALIFKQTKIDLYKYIEPLLAYGDDYAKGTFNGYAVCAGGDTWDGISVDKSTYGELHLVRGYDASLTQKIFGSLTHGVESPGGCATDSFFIVGGGEGVTPAEYDQTVWATVDSFDMSFTKSSRSSLSTAVKWPAAATNNGTYAIFAGGQYWNYNAFEHTMKSTVCAYNKSGTKTSCTALQKARAHANAISKFNNCAAFISGSATYSDGDYSSPFMDVYNSSLTRTTHSTSNVVLNAANSCVINDKIVCIGSQYSSSNMVTNSFVGYKMLVYDTSFTLTLTDASAIQYCEQIESFTNRKGGIMMRSTSTKDADGKTSYSYTMYSINSSLTLESITTMKNSKEYNTYYMSHMLQIGNYIIVTPDGYDDTTTPVSRYPSVAYSYED